MSAPDADALPTSIKSIWLKTAAFSLVELLVVIAVIAILAALLLPSLNRAKLKGLGIACMNNTRQIMLAWKMYADDHREYFPPNEDSCLGGNWASGCLNYDSANAANTDTASLLNPDHSKLGPYTKSAAIYKCPEDRSAVLMDGKVVPRARSVAMNQAVGTRRDHPTQAVAGPWLAGDFDQGQYLWRTYARMSDIVKPNPSRLWVLIDEHPDGINDAAFAVVCGWKGRTAKILDYPASFHGGAAGLAFADGHSEIHRWQDARTMPPATYRQTLKLNVGSANNPDVAWLQERTSAPRF